MKKEARTVRFQMKRLINSAIEKQIYRRELTRDQACYVRRRMVAEIDQFFHQERVERCQAARH